MKAFVYLILTMVMAMIVAYMPIFMGTHDLNGVQVTICMLMWVFSMIGGAFLLVEYFEAERERLK